MSNQVFQYQGRGEFDDDAIQYYLDHDLETYIRPVVEPIFHQILSCVDTSDKDILPFFECANSKVESLARRSILYVLSHPNQRETNKEKVMSMIIYPSLMDCIHNREELDQDTTKDRAALACIMGSCEKYIDLLINLMSMGLQPREKSPSKSHSSRRMAGRMSRSRSPRRMTKLSPHKGRLSPRGRVSPKGIIASPRLTHSRSSRKASRLSPISFRASLYNVNKK